MSIDTDTTLSDALYMPREMRLDLCVGLLEEIGARRINVREARGEIVHCCPLPWHDESRPSASLSFEKLLFKCLGCQSQGGILWFLAQTLGEGSLTFDPRGWLAGRSGFGGADFDLPALLAYLDSLDEVLAQRRTPTVLTKYSAKVLEPWDRICPLLTTGVPDLGLVGRGLPEENLRAARVGWDMETNRAVIPHFWKGDLIGWQSRRLSSDGSEKYLSTAEFPKDTTIYRLDEVPRTGPVVVVESPMSVLRHLHHLPIVATFGANITDHQIQQLKWYSEVIWWLDNDPAGWNAIRGTETATGVVDRLMPYTTQRIVDSDWHADAADLDDAEAERLVAGAVPYAAWESPTEALRCLSCRERHGGMCRTQTP